MQIRFDANDHWTKTRLGDRPVRARTYERAAAALARRLGLRAFAKRVTGFPEQSGWFQAYQFLGPMGTGVLSSVGEAFHVW